LSWLQSTKLALIGWTGLSKDALHIYVALALFFGSALLFRWPLKSWKPWAVVLAAALAGEAWDLRDRIMSKVPLEFAGNWHDIWNTMFWPTAIMLLARGTQLMNQRGH
jgi:hypothetical protein